MHKDFVSSHIMIFGDDKLYQSPPEQQTRRLLHINLLCKISMKKGILNVKLMEVPTMSGCQRYKQSNGGQLGNQGKGIKIIHPISLGIPLSNKTGLQPSNGSIGINLHCKTPINNQWLSFQQVNAPSPKYH